MNGGWVPLLASSCCFATHRRVGAICDQEAVPVIVSKLEVGRCAHISGSP